LPAYNLVKSRELKPDAIPMEFVEAFVQAIVKNDLDIYIL